MYNLIIHVHQRFGMGCSCLQMTFQACNIKEARHLYDQLTPLTPVLVSKANTVAYPFGCRNRWANSQCRRELRILENIVPNLKISQIIHDHFPKRNRLNILNYSLLLSQDMVTYPVCLRSVYYKTPNSCLLRKMASLCM